jgi:sugar (pentulose or hexulose) kinase
MTRDLVLAIDNGTQSVRALLIDMRGNLLAKSRVPIESYDSPKTGWAEQDPEVFWQAVCQACQELWKMPGVDKESIAGVALTTQRSTIICMGKDGQPLRPAIVWPDQRRTTGLKPIGGCGAGIPTFRDEPHIRLPSGAGRGQLDPHPRIEDVGQHP